MPTFLCILDGPISQMQLQGVSFENAFKKKTHWRKGKKKDFLLIMHKTPWDFDEIVLMIMFGSLFLFHCDGVKPGAGDDALKNNNETLIKRMTGLTESVAVHFSSS